MLINGDCIEELKKLEENSVHSIVTDPPYGLSFMGKKWDYDVPSVEMWQEALRVLKPGGHLLSFAGSRTYHRMAVNIEDAGFEIRDQIMWVYGSGFPKSHNIGKAVDKLQGNEREEYERNNGAGTSMSGKKTIYGSGVEKEDNNTSKFTDTKGNSPYEGWGTALKPAHEPIVVARKPFRGTVASNVLEHGTGGINIDGCRVGTETITTHGYKGDSCSQSYKEKGTKPELNEYKQTQGRFPANFIHDGSDEVVGLFPDTKSGGRKGVAKRTHGVTKFGSESIVEHPTEPSSGSASRFFMACKYTPNDAIMKVCLENINATNAENPSLIMSLIEKAVSLSSVLKVAPLNIDLVNQNLNALFVEQKPKNTAIDFVAKLVAMSEAPEGLVSQEELQVIQDFITSSKNSTQTQKNAGVEKWENTDITQITINLLKLCGYVQSVIDENTNSERKEKEELKSERARFVYQAKASKSERNKGLEGFEEKAAHRYSDKAQGPLPQQTPNKNTPESNFHPTVKPVKLMQYLVRLVTPKDGTVLDPFMGSGTTGIACKLEGFDFIGMEMDAEYIKIAEARIEGWQEETLF